MTARGHFTLFMILGLYDNTALGNLNSSIRIKFFQESFQNSMLNTMLFLQLSGHSAIIWYSLNKQNAKCINNYVASGNSVMIEEQNHSICDTRLLSPLSEICRNTYVGVRFSMPTAQQTPL